ncbi:hypothetical protein K488DRAFT_81579 [Vararia minispora EC-137]|uniref:Uncharacterized protein n=1 Tax=Vararia minispora EC-137 TaxID=1314806 RepID=A0ACB8R0D4_9AGAM|nr:hypothetical protein K488DRAFT_81579 [Vararia minispora EC-137]
MSSYTSDSSSPRANLRSPLSGTATFSTFTRSTPGSPSRYTYSSRSETRSALSDGSSNSYDRQLSRANISPSRTESTRTPSFSSGSSRSYSDDEADAREVEESLSVLDHELDQTEDALTEWSSRSSSITPSSYLTGSASSPSYTSSSSSYIPFTNTLRDARILSTITERSENPSSRPTSYNQSGQGLRPNSGVITSRLSTHSGHSRGATDPGPSDRPVPLGRRAGELIAFFEEKNTPERVVSPFSHSRTASVPSGPRSPSPYTTMLSGSTSYGYGSYSRPSSPTKSSMTPSRSLLPPGPAQRAHAPASGTPYTTSGFTPSTFSTVESSEITPRQSSLRRPQTPRSPLTSVRNIVAAWKDREPERTGKSTDAGPFPATKDGDEDGFFSLRRRAERGFLRARRESGEHGGVGPSNSNQRDNALSYDRDRDLPATPRTESTSLISNTVIPPPLDLAELGQYAKANQEPLRIGLLWYLNVHAPPPYRWQRCQALLYPHMLLLSWIAPGGGRGIVTLDLLNCTEVRSVPSPLHPSARDDVGTAAARRQSEAAALGSGGELGDTGLMEMLCPFQLLYSDGVERLGAESARERVRWVSAIWEALDHESVSIPDRSVTGSPVGSIRTIQSESSARSGASSASGSRSTTFLPPGGALPPIDSLPDLSDFHSLSGSSGTGSLIQRPSLRRAVDDSSVGNQTYLHPGDPRVIAPSRSSSLRRTTSMTDLDAEFTSAVRRARDGHPGLGFGLSLVGVVAGDGSPVTISSGPTLRRDVFVTPPPSAAGGRAHSRGPTSTATVTTSDDIFTTAVHSSDDTFHSLTSAPSTARDKSDSGSGGAGQMTDDTIVPLAFHLRGMSADSLSGANSSTETASSPTRLTRSRATRRRPESRSFGSTSVLSGSELSSDKGNSGSYSSSGLPSYDDGLSTLQTYTRESYTDTRNSYTSQSYSGSPVLTLSSSSQRETNEGSEIDSVPSESGSNYQTARSPVGSITSLPTIPDYETADTCSHSEYTTAPRCKSSSDSGESAFVTAPACKSESGSEYTTAPRCPSCGGSQDGTEYLDAECRCGQKAVEEAVQTTPLAPPQSLPPPRLPPSPPPVAAVPVPVPIPVPAVTESPALPSAPVLITPLPLPSPASSSVSLPTPSEVPTLPSSETESSVHPEGILLPSSSISLISSPTVSEPSPAYESLSLPSTSLLTTESPTPSDVTTPSAQPPSTRPPSRYSRRATPSIRESMWATETDISYESSILAASPSVQSIAFPEGPDISFDTSFLRPSASAMTSPDVRRLSAIPESTSVSSPSFIPVTSSPPSSTPSPIGGTPSISVSLTGSLSLPGPPTISVPSPSPVSIPTSPSVQSPSLSYHSSVSLQRSASTVSSVSTISMRSSQLDSRSLFEEEFEPEDVSTEPSLLSTRRSPTPRVLSPAQIPLPRSPSLLSSATSASGSVSIMTPSGNVPSIHSALQTIPSSASSSGPSMIVTHDVNLLLEYLNRVEGDRQKDTQRLHEHMDDIQDQIRDLGADMDNMLDRGGPTPVPLQPAPQPVKVDRSIQGSVVSEPRTRAAALPHLIPIPLTPPPMGPLSPAASSLSRSMSFLSSHHSDDFSLMGSETYPIRESPPSSPTALSEPSEVSSVSEEELPEISPSEATSGTYLSRSSSAMSSVRRQLPVPSPSPSPPSSDGTAMPATPRDVEMPDVRPDIHALRGLIEGIKSQADALWDGQISTNHMLDELRARSTTDPEVINRLQRLENMLRSLGAQRPMSAISLPLPEPVLEPSVPPSDVSDEDLRRLRSILEAGREGPEIHTPAPRPAMPDTLFDSILDLERRSTGASRTSVEPPPPLVTIDFRPHRRARARSVSPVLPPSPRRATSVPLVIIPRDQPPPRRPPPPARMRPDRHRPLGRPLGDEAPPSTPAPPPMPYQPPFPPAQMVDQPYPPTTPVTEMPPPTTVRPLSGTEQDINFDDEVHRRRRHRQGGSGYWAPSRPRPGPSVGPPVGDLHLEDLPVRPSTEPPMSPRRPWYTPRPGRDGEPIPGGAPVPPILGGVPPPPVLQPMGGPTVLQMPPIYNDMLALLTNQDAMTRASLEQQRDIIRYMAELNDWLGRDVHDRQEEIRSVLARIDDLRREFGSRPGIGQPVPAYIPQPVPAPGTQGAPGGLFPGGLVAPGYPPTQYPPGPYQQPVIVTPVPRRDDGSSRSHSPVIPDRPDLPAPHPGQWPGQVIPVGFPPQSAIVPEPPIGSEVFIPSDRTPSESLSPSSGPILPVPPIGGQQPPIHIHTAPPTVIVQSPSRASSRTPSPAPSVVVPVAPQTPFSIANPTDPRHQPLPPRPDDVVHQPGFPGWRDRPGEGGVAPGLVPAPMPPQAPSLPPPISPQGPTIIVQPQQPGMVGPGMVGPGGVVQPPVVIATSPSRRRSSGRRLSSRSRSRRSSRSPSPGRIPTFLPGVMQGQPTQPTIIMQPPAVPQAPTSRRTRPTSSSRSRSRDRAPILLPQQPMTIQPVPEDARLHGQVAVARAPEHHPAITTRVTVVTDGGVTAVVRAILEVALTALIEIIPRANAQHVQSNRPSFFNRRRRRRRSRSATPSSSRSPSFRSARRPHTPTIIQTGPTYVPSYPPTSAPVPPGTVVPGITPAQVPYQPSVTAEHEAPSRPGIAAAPVTESRRPTVVGVTPSSRRDVAAPETREGEEAEEIIPRRPPSPRMHPGARHVPESDEGDVDYGRGGPPLAGRAPSAYDRGERVTPVYRGDVPRAGSPFGPSGRSAAMRPGMHVPPATHVPYARSGTPSFTEMEEPAYRGAPGAEGYPEGALPRTADQLDPSIAGARPTRDRILALEDETRNLRRRVGNIEQHMDEEDHRLEELFEGQESERQQRFEESERRRDEDAERRHAKIWNDLEERLRALPPIAPEPTVEAVPGGIPEVDVEAVPRPSGTGVPGAGTTLPIPPPPSIPHIRPAPSMMSDPSDLIEPVRDAAIHAASIYSRDIRDIIQEERDAAGREREIRAQELADERAEKDRVLNTLAEERLARIRDLEAELEHCREECERERTLRQTEEALRREQEADEARERDEALRRQLEDITNLLQQQSDAFAEKRQIMDRRWLDEDTYRDTKSKQWDDLMNVVRDLVNGQEEERNKAEEARADQAEQLNTLNDFVRDRSDAAAAAIQDMNTAVAALINEKHNELLAHLDEHAQVRVPFNVQAYLDDFSRSLANEVRVLLQEVGDLREKKRAAQFELGTLMCLRAKYDNGEFDVNWQPTTGPLAPQPAAEAPPPPQAPPDPARPAWRTVPRFPGAVSGERVRRRRTRPAADQPVPPPPPPPPPATAPIPPGAHRSWATWQPDPQGDYTPPPAPPETLLAPPPQPMGLFGPRSPRDSLAR